jgi:hypothetical protein
MSVPATVPLDRHADFHMLAPATLRLPPPPRFHFGGFPAPLAALFYGRSRVPGAGVFTTGAITVSAGLILRAADQLIEAPPLNWQVSMIEQALARHGLPDPTAPVRTPDGPCALIVTPGYPIFGHWLADILPRLGLLEAAGHDLDSLTYIVAEDTPAFGLELLRLVGIGEERLIRLGAAGPIRPNTLLLPTFVHNGRQFTPLMAHAARVLRARIEARFGKLEASGTPASILVSRRGWGARRMQDRDAFEAAAQRHGFTLVSPETLPMLDQLRLFAGAREIIGEYGSGLHSSLFSPPGTVVCALRGIQAHPAFLQSGIGDALDQPTGYLFGRSSDDPTQRGFEVPPDDLAACLSTVFGPVRAGV